MDYLIIHEYKGRGSYIDFYIDFDGARYWFQTGHLRKATFVAENSKIIKGYVYPCYSYMCEGKRFYYRKG